MEGKFIAESTRIVNGGDVSSTAQINLNDVPETPLLDTSANKGKAQLASSGALANRKPPTKAGALTVSSFKKMIYFSLMPKVGRTRRIAIE